MSTISRRSLLAVGACLALPASLGARAAARSPLVRPPKPLVLGHRGAPAHRPEHTLASYAKAIADGADFVEPDLVATRDGVLVARHENNIAETTDVAAHPEFADRRTTRTIDGTAVTGWFTEDFTLAELKTLRAKERLGALRPESQGYDGAFQIVSFEEIADFVAAEAAARGRTIGLIPELKHGTYFAGIGLPLEPRFLASLRAGTYLRRAPIIVQSFEIGNLKALRGQLAGLDNVQLMQLVEAPGAKPFDVAAAGGNTTYADMLTPEGLAQIASYADWVAPATRAIIPLGPDGRLAASSGVVAAAHKAGLLVGTWTFRPENQFLAADFRDRAAAGARNPAGSVAEIRRYLAEGLDAFFTDDPALGRKAVDAPA
jgi:glycerophosphoryl diester phosphodiesterase